MEEFLNVVKDTPIPTLLILAGLIFIFLGLVTKFGGVEIPSQQRLWAIFLGIFLLVVGLIVNFHSNQNFKTLESLDSPGNDIGYYRSLARENCISKCKSEKGCVAVVVSPETECWLKSKVGSYTKDSARDTILIK